MGEKLLHLFFLPIFNSKAVKIFHVRLPRFDLFLALRYVTFGEVIK